VINMNEKLFMMSMRFNKESPEDFGLIPSEETDIYIMPSDKSLWKKRNLYDFGWGKENGYYKLPLPQFDDLVNIIINSESKDNKYGAAAIILDDFNDDLLFKCQEIFKDGKNAKKYGDLFKILQLDIPMNRSSTLGKSYKEISEDFEKWKDISKQVLKYIK